MSKYFELKAKKDGKRQEMKLIEGQVNLLNAEIELRKNQIADLYKKYELLGNEAQEIADQQLELEYQTLNANGL